MERANCNSIWLGIESFNDDILKINNKGHDTKTILNALNLVGKTSIQPKAFIMLGLPGERIDTINSTLQKLNELNLPYTKSIITATPRYDTEYYKMAIHQFPFLEESWHNLNLVKGLVSNEVNHDILQEAIYIMKERNFSRSITVKKDNLKYKNI